MATDGWFREINDMWSGQAMTLKVKQILHHEKSLYQDVLVFESTDYGNVLVLDNVIQCTERDEFSYQEMISHLALMSHPNPQKVLVIGGGDGGVLREVIKHDCVKEAVLCDIDEAVIRVSKQYLPDMSKSYTSDKVRVHIGDGFKFLADYKNEFDVIITDSSDPDGPAESLFQLPYFELLEGALREGGVISTQGWNTNPVLYEASSMSDKKPRDGVLSPNPMVGPESQLAISSPHPSSSNFCHFNTLLSSHLQRTVENPFHASLKKKTRQANLYVSPGIFSHSLAENQWLHLSLIERLKKDCRKVFPVAEYAYTTIPTYPSGQIGFMVCCKDKDRDVTKPLRRWTEEEEEKLCKYYNARIHEAAFVLPTFARKQLQL
ncbi:hypothetical protein ABW21_db0204007 [Orbilia brochopaga]|nr:hypothetical protein ABW21_db0204007 [Drechslerella brochopaga]